MTLPVNEPGRQTALIVALDHSQMGEAEAVADQLGGRVAAFKVGLTLFSSYGPQAVSRIARRGPVFCDLKFHDIPHQVGRAAAAIASLGAWMLTVHASGGSRMIRAAVQAAEQSDRPPIVAAVTVLTSLSAGDLNEVGQGIGSENRGPDDQVVRLALLAAGAGAGAIVCSPLEVELLRKELGEEIILVTPGVRPAGADSADQARVMTPGEASRAGADYIVVGRPVTGASDPVAAAESLYKQMQRN